MTSRLSSRIRAERKRLQLSQDDISFLLGLSSGATVSQHESVARLPELKLLLKYEVLFGKSAAELFPKLRWDVETEMLAQVRALMSELEARPQLSAQRKLEILETLLRRIDSNRL